MPDSRPLPAQHVQRHSGVVRLTHWLTVAAFVALLISGYQIVVSHPRFYWGETGNVMTRPLFTLHIAASRDTVPTGFNYVAQDGNGWGRYLHFEAVWLLFFTALIYLMHGLLSGHFVRDLLPASGQRSLTAVARSLRDHLTFKRSTQPGYNTLQRITYITVIFVLFPAMFWTGVAMSPAYTAIFPWPAESLGGHQTARTLHFIITGLLTLFVLMHIVMVACSGFLRQMRGITLGAKKETP